MFKPNKYEDVDKSIVVLGADIVQKLKRREYNIDDLFKEIKKKKAISLNQLMNSITFLWVVDVVEYSDLIVSLKKQNVS